MDHKPVPLLNGVSAVAKVFDGTGTSEKLGPPGCAAGAEPGSAWAQFVAGTGVFVGLVVVEPSVEVPPGVLVAPLVVVTVVVPPPRLQASKAKMLATTTTNICLVFILCRPFSLIAASA
jgi:hypothetical protein